MDRNAADLQEVYAWGRLEPGEHVVVPASFADELADAVRASDKRPLLCRGLGRSYGDVGLITGGYLLDTARADHFLSADWETGLVRAEAGLSLDALLRICVPRGWFLPVSPGTKFVTLGGAVANDVHGNRPRRNMLGISQDKIPVVRARELVIESSVSLDQALAMNDDVHVDVICRHQQVAVEWHEHQTGPVEMRCIRHERAVDQVRGGIGRKLVDRDREEMPVPKIVAVDIAEERTAREC